jgi:hypothetical protein
MCSSAVEPDPDPNQSGKQDPDPHQSDKLDQWFSVRIKVISWIRIRVRDYNQKCMEYEVFFKVLSLYLEARIRIRIKVKGRIRICLKVTSRIRIRITVMLIRNTDVFMCFSSVPHVFSETTRFTPTVLYCSTHFK